MTTSDERFQRLVQAARDDPEVLGVALIGSRGKGFPSEASDYDVMVMVRDEAPAERQRWYEALTGDGIECWTLSAGEFARYASSWGSEFAWEICWHARYAYADAAVLVDKTGQLRQLIDWKGVVPDDLRLPLVRESLDGYVNSLYRSLKCLRNGNRLGARLEAADSIGYALTFVFALEGRHRPYYGYLERELQARPLQGFPLTGEELVGMIAAIVESGEAPPQQRLLSVVDGLARRAGCGDILDSWGEKYAWMREFSRE